MQIRVSVHQDLNVISSHPLIGILTSGEDQGGLSRHKSCFGLETKCSVVCYEWYTAVHARGKEEHQHYLS